MSLTGNKIPIGCTPKQKTDSPTPPLVDDMDDTNATPPDSGLFHTFPEVPNLSFKRFITAFLGTIVWSVSAGAIKNF